MASKLLSLLFLLAPTLVFAGTASSIILIPKTTTSKPVLASFISAPLFTESEQQFLKKEHREALSQARIYPNLSASQKSALLNAIRTQNRDQYLIEESAAVTTQEANFSDPLSPLQWGIRNRGVAQKISIDHYTSGYVGGKPGEDVQVPDSVSPVAPVIVAVIDTGADFNHPDLQGTFISKGFNILTQKDDTQDVHGHGTHLSGIIAAQANSIGGRGITQNVKVLPVKVIQTGPNAPIRPQSAEGEPGSTGTALTENVARGMLYAIQNGAKVMNLSLAWPTTIRSTLVESMIALAKEKEVLIVASAGNDSTAAAVYPCIYESVICVGAHGPDGAFAHFSNFGSSVDLLAPGTAILSTWPTTKSPTSYAGGVGYEYKNGTSMSAPFVAGALGELLSRGMSPQEAKNRLLLGTRSTASEMQFRSSTVPNFIDDPLETKKWSRFGNLDLARAIEVKPTALILPSKKAAIEILWDGTSQTLSLPIRFTNLWKASGQTEIQIEGQSFLFDTIRESETKTISYPFSIDRETSENLIYLNAVVNTAGQSSHPFKIAVSITRGIRADRLPLEAQVDVMTGVLINDQTMIRTVVNADALDRPDYVFFNDKSATIVQDSKTLGTTTFEKYTADQLLNAYRVPGQGYVFIFSNQSAGNTRPTFFLHYFSPALKFLKEVTISTETTILSENFQWMKMGTESTPAWISIGYTPKADLPAYDPWNPDFTDVKTARIYYVKDNVLRIVPLKDNQLPIQILPKRSADFQSNSIRVLIAEGLGYNVQYSAYTISDGKVLCKEALDFGAFRMMIGTGSTLPVYSLNEVDRTGEYAFSSASTPGNLRVSGRGELTFDDELKRGSALEALIMTSGIFTDHKHAYFFTQTHYDLKFHQSGNGTVYSTSLNRYSYIPSMIANRSFFPTLIQGANHQALPAIYIPASIATGASSEVIVADLQDPKEPGILKRPAKFKFKVIDPACQGLGNLLPATQNRPAQQVFFCNQSRVLVPLVSTAVRN